MIPETEKSTFEVQPERLRDIAKTIAERFDPKSSSGEDVALAANASLGLIAAAAELERLRDIESKFDQAKASALKFLYATAKIGDALAILVLRDEQRRKSRADIEGPLHELFKTLKKIRVEEAEPEAPSPPKSEPSQPQPTA